MAAHIGIAIAWIGAELAGRSGRVSTRRGVVASGAVAVVFVLAGGIAEHRIGQRKVRQSSEIATSNILKQAEVKTVETLASQPRFTGRYRLGEANAKVRIVVISDFQCADCQKLDNELMELARRPDVSLSMKHFPFCRDCNTNVPKTLHANACWAARAAEAVGMVGGNARFWEMQKWLFARGGGFTEAELRRQIAAMGMPVDQFMAAFTGRDTLELVKADVAESMTLGISRTPMVFVNGVECVGWENAGAVTRIVNALLEAGISQDPQATDQPPSAMEKYLQMWRSAPVELAAQATSRRRGDGLARIEIVGDYQESGTRELNQLIAKILAEGWSAGLVFHHYPADSACNPAIPRQMHDRACELSRLVLAAGLVGGDVAYWKAHDAAMQLGGSVPIPQNLIQPIAAASGIPMQNLQDQMQMQVNSKAVQALLSQSAAIGQQVQISELPTLFVNGRRVARWRGGVDSEVLIRSVIQEACGNTKQ